jgi:hypothetical protein
MALRSRLSLRAAAPYALLVGLLAFLAPIAARATTCQSNSLETCAANTDGNSMSSGTGTSTVFSLTGSEVTAIGWRSNGNFGHLAFTTGDLESGGSLTTGGTFSATNSTFTIAGSYNNVHNGTIFKGSFSGPITWQLINGGTGPGDCTATTGSCEYDLTGSLNGTWYPNKGHGGANVNGVTVQLYFKTTNGYYHGGGGLTDVGGFSNFDTPLVTPEPSELGLMGTGFLGIGLVAMRRLKAKNKSRDREEL